MTDEKAERKQAQQDRADAYRTHLNEYYNGMSAQERADTFRSLIEGMSCEELQDVLDSMVQRRHESRKREEEEKRKET